MKVLASRSEPVGVSLVEDEDEDEGRRGRRMRESFSW